MPKDDYRRERDAKIARRASLEKAYGGKVRSFDTLHDDPSPPTYFDASKTTGCDKTLPSKPGTALPNGADKSFVEWMNRLVLLARDNGVRVSKISKLPLHEDRHLVPVLLIALSSRNSNVVDYSRLGRAFKLLGREAIDDLGRRLESKSFVVQMNAARTLCHVGVADETTIIRLEQLVKSERSDVRKASQTALEYLRRERKESQPLLNVNTQPAARGIAANTLIGKQSLASKSTLAGDDASGSIHFAGVTISATLAGTKHVRKTQEGARWVLATRRGVKIAEFATEADLDNWWVTFQMAQGRTPSARDSLPRATKGVRRKVIKSKQTR